jgi:hypothetical protein
MKDRIRHLFPHSAPIPNNDHIPRGWITPLGHFLKTKEHWVSINSHFRRLETRALGKEEAAEDAEAAERNAHLAYSLGWISVGHAGKLNAIAHQKTFQVRHHPAVVTLRSILAQAPESTIQIELQMGSYVSARGVHEDFELIECDLDILIKRGNLRSTLPPSA